MEQFEALVLAVPKDARSTINIRLKRSGAGYRCTRATLVTGRWSLHDDLLPGTSEIPLVSTAEHPMPINGLKVDPVPLSLDGTQTAVFTKPIAFGKMRAKLTKIMEKQGLHCCPRPFLYNITAPGEVQQYLFFWSADKPEQPQLARSYLTGEIVRARKWACDLEKSDWQWLPYKLFFSEC